MTDDATSGRNRGYVGSNVFMARVDPEQFGATVADPVDLTAHADRPAALSERESARIGAVATGDRSQQMFGRMAPGDLVLCYADGAYVGVGRVGATFDDGEWAGEALWPEAEIAGGYVLEDFVELDLPARVVNSLFDYAPDYSPGDLIRVAEGRFGSSLAAIRVAVERFSERRS
jgi:hypothetical protein